MPELPEVETVRRGLAELIGLRVVDATLHRRSVLVVPGDPPGGFSRSSSTAKPKRVRPEHLLVGGTIDRVLRLGKQLALVAADGRVLAGHLGMTGRFIRIGRKHRLSSPDRGHVHATWRFEDGSRLAFRDPRRFGGLWSYPSVEALHSQRWAALGPDALTVRSASLAASLSGSRRAVKAALLDQRVLAGVGNIYADEALFDARIAPGRLCDGMAADEVRELAAAVRGQLRRAIKAGGSTIGSYANTAGQPGAYQLAHRVYGRGGQPCLRCGYKLCTGVIAQRTTVWCPKCQG